VPERRRQPEPGSFGDDPPMTGASGPRGAVVLGIDGGNSKVDVALATADGTLLAAARGPTVSHQRAEFAAGMRGLDSMVRSVAAEAGLAGGAPFADVAVACLAGADYPSDIRQLQRGIESLRLADRVIVVNDTIAALRAGASRPWGGVLVCGQGINASVIAPDGRIAGYPAMGPISGDWGGGGGIGMAALGAAVRGRDGRGAHTSLERSVPAFFGLKRPGDVTRAMYDGRIDAYSGASSLSPVVFEEARAGDEVAREIVERLARELASMLNALVRRLHLTRLDMEVVLAGGVFRTGEPGFYASLERLIREVTPRATFVHLRWPPVVGALLLGLERIAGDAPGPGVAVGLRSALATWDEQEISRTGWPQVEDQGAGPGGGAPRGTLGGRLTG
jgi:N-acetylglucosamine kinase-like BadF-type ATPase